MIRKTFLVLHFCCILCIAASAQRQHRFVSIAVTDHHSAYPFAAFASLFAKEINPGIELGYGFNWTTKQKHDWYQAFKAGYFYHRFVQHAIPLYTQFGYRYKPVSQLQLSAAIGAGYLHSIPATAVLEQRSDGSYKNAKGIGRGQGIFNFTTGVQYVLASKQTSAAAVFLNYQQLLQAPFIKSYVPLLPYNGISLGVSLPLQKQKAH